MGLFPLFLKIEGRSALVVGAGEIAEAKIASLLDAGASVTVIAPQATSKVRDWAHQGAIQWHPRVFDASDVDGKDLVIAATSSAEVNHSVYAESRQRGVLCNVVDDPPYCDFYFGAVVKRGELQIAISTGGQSPAFAQHLRRQLEGQFGPEYGEWVNELGRQRRSVLDTYPATSERKKMLHQQAQQRPFFDNPALKSRDDKTAQRNDKKEEKKVYLIGAGPGDPELLTLKAHRLISAADVVLHDDLISAEILRLAKPDALLLNVGKRHGEKSMTQEKIHAMLLFFAAPGRTVVRLKGGDPMIFGRAAEEIEVLEAAGIKVEVVPGITAALAAASTAQVSLTDRRTASSVLFVSGHQCAGKGGPDWERLVRQDITLAIYMPGSDYAALAKNLRNAGLRGATPCVIVSRAGTAAQQVHRSRLSRLHGIASLPAPSILLVGDAMASKRQSATENLDELLRTPRFEDAENIVSEALEVSGAPLPRNP